MSTLFKYKLKNYVDGYKKVNAITAKERKTKSKEDTFEALQSNLLFAIKNSARSTSSGFVEMYRILLKSKP